MTVKREPSSFRDPSGFLFSRGNQLYRQINLGYAPHYDALMASGLYDKLVAEDLLVPHVEVPPGEVGASAGAYKVIEPERVEFISYPYEWSFSQLKDAALTTLRIQQLALAHDLSIKDASAYNIQYVAHRPVLIDTLSFEKHTPRPWVAYGQFCRHFLAPLALMSCRDIRMGQLLRVHLDGVPLDLASRLLPRRTYGRFSTLVHIHLHARAERRYADAGQVAAPRRTARMTKTQLLAFADSLAAAVRRLKCPAGDTEWGEYYAATNYSADAFAAKKELLGQFLDEMTPGTVWDLGANEGVFSRVASARGIRTVAFDIDPVAVEKNYLQCKQDADRSLLPLLADLTNPSPAQGWDHAERMSLRDRGPADCVVALALIHHLAISNNVPLSRVAQMLAGLGKSLIIEFVPKRDSQVQRLLATREDIFPHYTQEDFELRFAEHFVVNRKAEIPGTERTLYRMTRR